MEDLRGKKLLVLAGSAHEMDLVRRANELGIYTIVTDYYTSEVSPAKTIAHEAWDISWSDIDKLEQKCREEKIDGITAGYSEFTVECLIKLCERLHLPCYSTMEQLEITRNKIVFKEECRKNNVPVVKEYASISEVESFPVIIKPVDRGGSIGVSVAVNEVELRKAYEYAMEMSVCKEVIIEEYIYEGTKFDAYYAISEGQIKLLSTSDTINAAKNGFEKVVQSGWLFPSRYHDMFLQQVDSNLRKMILNMGIQNGYIFFSGFVRKNNFVFFETGFRLSGGHMYRYIEAKENYDIQDLFIYHALYGNTNKFRFSSNEEEDLKAVVLNFYAKEGVISEIKGIHLIEQMKDWGYTLLQGKIGQKCEQDKAILSKIAMFHMYNILPEKLAEDVKKVNEVFGVYNSSEDDLVYDRMSEELIASWWE